MVSRRTLSVPGRRSQDRTGVGEPTQHSAAVETVSLRPQRLEHLWYYRSILRYIQCITNIEEPHPTLLDTLHQMFACIMMLSLTAMNSCNSLGSE